jgi:hypothetical protein
MSTIKHLRLSIDFTVEIADEPPLLPEGTIEPPDPGYDGRQFRLLEALKAHPQVLERWMHSLIASQLYIHPSYYWEDAILGGEIAYETLLAPVLEMLSAEDRGSFRESARCGVFEEDVDMVVQSFTVTEDTSVIIEQEEQGIMAVEQREAVARAIYSAYTVWHVSRTSVVLTPWENLQESTREMYRQMADSAIVAYKRV